MSRLRTDGDSDPALFGRKWGYAAIAVLVLAGVLGGIGWNWRSGVTLNTIEIVSSCETEWRLFTAKPCPSLKSTHEQVSTLLSDMVGAPLYELNPIEVIGRVEGLPWVQEARMERSQSGKMLLTLSERTPVLLAMDRGRPAYFVDAEGYRMPLVQGVAYDVPLLHGLAEEYDPVKPVVDPAARDLAAVLADLNPSIQALISEVELSRSRDIVFHTTVLDTRGSIQVRMSDGNIREQLVKLHAFWHQTLLPDPDRDIRQIDLRFDSQIVTR
jgi:cell division protein FtsQ